MKEQLINYDDGEAELEGFFCFDETRPGPLPAVLISHAWGGRDEFVADMARQLARLGYAGFALDVYGKGRRGNSREENARLIAPFMQDRALLARRMQAALSAVRRLSQVDARRIAALGYCFGGLCVLDLARSGADVRGAVSVHGLLKPSGLPARSIAAKVLVLHGHDDPIAPVDDVVALEQELTEAGADWQLHAYGGTMHAFTNPAANDADFGTVYQANADRRSWTALLNFLEEVLR